MRRLLHLTDTHIDADAAARFDGMDTRASFARTLAAARAEGAHGLVLGGDLSMDGSAASYRWLAAQLATLDLPWWAVPGNHDDPQAWPGTGGSAFGVLPRIVALSPWRLLLLSTRVAGEPGGLLGAAQLEWLGQALATAHAGYDLVVMHHPPLAVDSPWIDAMGLADAAGFWDCLARPHRVRAVICGHVHQVFERVRGPLRVLTTPSTCVQFLPRARRYATDPRAPAYRVLDLGDDGSLATRVARVGA
ncbi:MAG: metallophosphoesterase [Gammaproteobacteria bacterium]|nr:metallophosphoesterase [Gammaproteobacteria bacterium]MCP5202449.1 metallophosphoesterase [Gammaproteobacteria bacterium]